MKPSSPAVEFLVKLAVLGEKHLHHEGKLSEEQVSWLAPQTPSLNWPAAAEWLWCLAPDVATSEVMTRVCLVLPGLV